MTGRRPFALVAKESKNKHSNRLVGQVWMRWGERNSGLERCKGKGVEGRGQRDKFVVSHNREK